MAPKEQTCSAHELVIKQQVNLDNKLTKMDNKLDDIKEYIITKKTENGIEKQKQTSQYLWKRDIKYLGLGVMLTIVGTLLIKFIELLTPL